MATWGFYLPALVWWTVDLELGPLKLVLLGTVMEVTLLVSEVPTGVVADRFSRKWSVVIAYLIMGVSMVLSVATTNYPVLLAAQALFAVGFTFRSGADVAWLTDEVGHDARKLEAGAPDGATLEDEVDISELIVRRHRIGMTAGLLGIVAVMILGQWSLRGAVAITGVVMFVAGLFFAALMTDNFRANQAPGEVGMVQIFRDGLGVARRVPSLRLLLLAMLLMGLGSEALDRLGFKRFLDDGDFGDDSLLYLGLLFLALSALGAFVTWRVEKALGSGLNLPLLAFGLIAVASFGAAVAALAPVVGVAVGMIMQDPAREALDPVSAAWANNHAPPEVRATVLSFVSQAHGVGEATGGVLLASLAELAGIRMAILVAAGLWACSALIARQAAHLN